MSEILLIVGVLLYGFVLSYFIPFRYHFVANILAAISAVGIGLGLGLSFDDMGMGFDVVGRGVLVAGFISLGIMVGVFIAASLPPIKRYFVYSRTMEHSRVAYETAVRIPLSTALTEEIIFRGVLLGLLLSATGTVAAVVICSFVFGLWHIMPSLDRLRLHVHASKRSLPMMVAYAGGTVAATTLAGVFFSWLRILSGSIIAPWLTHWSINASAMLASAYIAHGRNTIATQPKALQKKERSWKP
jgi:uncharacterized protein